MSSASLLRFITCGSVDDGKSTLIGRLLHDSQMIFADQLAAITKDSKTSGTTGEKIDLALLVDGLQSEREQGITIDVAYRYFSTEKRKFIIADTPGHEQYTRNMATGASTCDLAIILIDARYGVQTQTRRHSFIVSLLGIKHIIVAVNKMDLVAFSQTRYKEVQDEYLQLAGQLDIPDIHFVPVSALDGDNVVNRSESTPWFRGRTLMEYLETIEINRGPGNQDFRFPVQMVNRPHQDFRGYSGSIASGSVRKGDTIRALPSGKISTIQSIVTFDGELEEATAPSAVTLTLNDEIDISRGDMIIAKASLPHISDRLRAKVVWMNDEPLVPHRQYLLKMGTKVTTAVCDKIHHQIDVNTLKEKAADNLLINEIGLLDFSLHETVIFDKYTVNQQTGSFILIDRISNLTMGAGLIEEPLVKLDTASANREPQANLTRQEHLVSHQSRCSQKQQKPVVLWFTGLSGAGKSAIANAVDQLLVENNNHTYLIDGDNVRLGLNKDLGFSETDRRENMRRVSEVSKLFVDAGLIVLTASISPFHAEREKTKHLLGSEHYVEVFIDTPLHVCELRDPKGLYRKARTGEIPSFTGITSPYEKPESPDIHILTEETSTSEAARKIIQYLRDHGIIQ